jgi:diguanylate cyclase (GGDEF)-like protein
VPLALALVVAVLLTAPSGGWILAGVAGLLVIAALVAVLSDILVGIAARPLERIVDLADSIAAHSRTPEDVADQDVARVTQAFDRIVRDLRVRDEELHETRNAFRLALDRLGDVLAATHDLEGIVDAIVDTALLAVPADAAVYYELVGLPARLQAVRARGVPFDRLVLDGSGVAGAAALTRELTCLPGPADLDPAEPAAVAAVAVPVSSQGRLIGVVGAYGTTIGRAFTSEEVGSLHTLVRQAEVAIANIELHAQAQREALTDGVTGLWNRRQFDLRCRDAQLSAARFGEPFGVVLFDLDNFKRINDAYDHFTGDAALVHMAGVLRRSSRDVDVVARWGGEEFAILVQRAGMPEAMVLAQRALSELRQSPLVYRGQTIQFTASAGVASSAGNGPTAAEVVAAADAALLQAKAVGKDRAVPAEPVGPLAAPAEPRGSEPATP